MAERLARHQGAGDVVVAGGKKPFCGIIVFRRTAAEFQIAKDMLARQACMRRRGERHSCGDKGGLEDRRATQLGIAAEGFRSSVHGTTWVEFEFRGGRTAREGRPLDDVWTLGDAESRQVASAVGRWRWRRTAPTPPKPMIISAQAAGSGTPPGAGGGTASEPMRVTEPSGTQPHDPPPKP